MVFLTYNIMSERNFKLNYYNWFLSHDTGIGKKNKWINKKRYWLNSQYFVDVFNETIIPLALVGYKMIIANLALRLVGYLPFHIELSLVE